MNVTRLSKNIEFKQIKLTPMVSLDANLMLDTLGQALAANLASIWGRCTGWITTGTATTKHTQKPAKIGNEASKTVSYKYGYYPQIQLYSVKYISYIVSVSISAFYAHFILLLYMNEFRNSFASSIAKIDRTKLPITKLKKFASLSGEE